MPSYYSEEPVWGELTGDTPFSLAIIDNWLTVGFELEGREHTIAISKFAVIDLLEKQRLENNAEFVANFPVNDDDEPKE